MVASIVEELDLFREPRIVEIRPEVGFVKKRRGRIERLFLDQPANAIDELGLRPLELPAGNLVTVSLGSQARSLLTL